MQSPTPASVSSRLLVTTWSAIDSSRTAPRIVAARTGAKCRSDDPPWHAGRTMADDTLETHWPSCLLPGGLPVLPRFLPTGDGGSTCLLRSGDSFRWRHGLERPASSDAPAPSPLLTKELKHGRRQLLRHAGILTRSRLAVFSDVVSKGG